MHAIIRFSAVIALGFCLSGCVAYEVASTALSATTTVVGGVASVAGTVVTAPFGGSSDKDADKD